MNIKDEKSARALVFQYLKDHPLEAVGRSCAGLYEAFKATSEDEKKKLRSYKAVFVSKVFGNDISKSKLKEILIELPKKSSQDKNKEKSDYPPLPTEDPGFKMFCRWLSFPAYRGMYEWQEEHHNYTWDSEYEMTLVPRDHGKSVIYTEKYQWGIQYQEMDVLLLGWTDRRKEIARYVYNFFYYYGQIEQDRHTSPFHFRTKNGGRFDCYLITSKETLGMHSEGDQARFNNMTEDDWEEYKSLFGVDLEAEAERIFTEDELKEYIESRKGSNRKLWISIDDPIDITFMKERHKEETLEMHFNSSLYGIHPFKWSFTGTRKFEGDFFDFIQGKFKEELVVYLRSTRDSKGKLLCPERFTHPDLDTYKDDLLNGKRCLLKIREHVGEYAWWSEYEQSPRPVAGEVWDHIASVHMLDTPVNRKHDLLVISIDRATTTKKHSSYTGCVIVIREIGTGTRIIIEDLTGHIEFDTLLIEINDFLIEFRAKHENIMIVLVVEKQGGGNDFCTMARNIKYFFRPDGSRVRNRIAEIAIIEEVHNMGEKVPRIKERLLAPIKNEKIKVLRALMNTEVVKEILDFPHGPYLDGIDALANIEFIMLEEYHETKQGNPLLDQLHIYGHHDTHQTLLDDDEYSTLQKTEVELRKQLREELKRIERMY